MGLRDLVQTIGNTAATIGGPMALLTDPTAIPRLTQAVSVAAQQLPPSPVIMGAFSRIIRDAIVAENVERGPSPGFMDAARASGKFDDDAQIVAFHRFTWESMA